MPQAAADLWTLALDRQQLDPDGLFAAIERFLQALSRKLSRPATLYMGDSTASILSGHLLRRADPKFLKTAQDNWFTLFGQSLPA